MSDDKRALVTGANTGIGKVTALELAKRGYAVTLACRNLDKGAEARDEIAAEVSGADLSLLALDLSSLASVREAAAAELADERPLHLLVNNAGLAAQKGQTVDGFELAFGVNHLGHFLFTERLRDKLVASAPARIVIVASRAHMRVNGIDFDAVTAPTKTPTGFPEYCVSKLANVLHARELARRLEGTGVTVYALHPGVVASDVWRKVPAPFRWMIKRFMITNEEGAATSLYCATAPELVEVSGRYYDESREATPSKTAQDDALAAELWRRSVAWTKSDA